MKQSGPLSSQVATRISWSPMSGLKGVEPPLQFGERTRDCSPGQAGKGGPHLAMTGARHEESSWTRDETRAPAWVDRLVSSVPAGGGCLSVVTAAVRSVNPEMSHFVPLCPLPSPVPRGWGSACLTHNNKYGACSEMFLFP